MRWSILLTSIVLTGCFDPNDPPGGGSALATGSSGSTSEDVSATSNQTDPTSPTDPGEESDTTSSTDTTDPTGDTDAPSQCTCAIAAPNNWNGPLVVARGADLP